MLHEQDPAATIAQTLWQFERERVANNGGCTPESTATILVGHDLWFELLAHHKLNAPDGVWRYDGEALSCAGSVVHRVDAPVVAGLRGWRIVLDTPVAGQAPEREPRMSDREHDARQDMREAGGMDPGEPDLW